MGGSIEGGEAVLGGAVFGGAVLYIAYYILYYIPGGLERGIISH